MAPVEPLTGLSLVNLSEKTVLASRVRETSSMQGISPRWLRLDGIAGNKLWLLRGCTCTDLCPGE